ncbi:MAG: hypothetical protein ACYTE3_18565, partial [Planctomycetota bacterium]
QLMGILVGKLGVVRLCASLINVVRLSVLNVRIVGKLGTDDPHVSVRPEQIRTIGRWTMDDGR